MNAGAQAALPGWLRLVHWVLGALLFPLGLLWMGLSRRLRTGALLRMFGAPRVTPDAVWLHGASAGDVRALLPVAQALTRRQPDAHVVVSAWTDEGLATARRRFSVQTAVFYFPWDASWVVRRYCERIQPRALVLEALELWPGLLIHCAQHGIPVMIINGRLSARSAGRYQAWAPLFRPLFSSVARVFAATLDDAARFVALGVAPRRVRIAASTKYATVEVLPRREARACRLVLGSTHPGEEALLAPALRALLDAVDELSIEVVPRYPREARATLGRLARAGIRAHLASGREALGAASAERVTVVDCLGVLGARYREAQVAFVGGSLEELGGHNPVEAAAAGACVVFGPHMDNCRREALLLEGRGAATTVTSGEAFGAVVLTFLRDPEACAVFGTAALAVARELQQTAEAAAAEIAAELSNLART